MSGADKKLEQFPVAVRNFRRIWGEKKREMGVTQSDAAEKLGWTQGAFSQYLNNVSKMNPKAVIKLANYLNVDPLEIDPQLYKGSRSIPIRNSVKKAKLSYPSLKAIAIYLEKNTGGMVNGKKWELPTNTCLICEPAYRSKKGPFVWYDLDGEVFFGDDPPPQEQLSQKYRLHSVHIEIF